MKILLERSTLAIINVQQNAKAKIHANIGGEKKQTCGHAH